MNMNGIKINSLLSYGILHPYINTIYIHILPLKAILSLLASTDQLGQLILP